MNANIVSKEEAKDRFSITGARLNHILDNIGFKQGRGRVKELQIYLQEHAPEIFGELKYTTVRSWFQNHLPHMRKIDFIIETLQKNYEFNNDVEPIKSWWKVGGYYPFNREVLPTKSDSVYIGQVYLLVYETSYELGIDLNTQLSREVLGSVFDRILFHCQEKNISIDSKELKELVKSILLLAKEGLL